MTAIRNLQNPSGREATTSVGIDGCRGGWVAAIRDGSGLRLELVEDLIVFLGTLGPGSRVGIDIPIGLLDAPQPGGRQCDRETRRLVGPRASSVFSAPTRGVLGAKDFAATRGQGLTLQAFHLLPKIREVDAWITAERQSWVREFHPELCFTRLLGTPPAHSKRTREGRTERLSALPTEARSLQQDFRERHSRQLVAGDDILDAFAVLLGVEAWWAGEDLLLPEGAVPLDSAGLAMSIQG